MKNVSAKSKLLLAVVIFVVTFSNKSYAQLSPPGLGEGKNAAWFAFGVRQSLDSLKQKESTTYVGYGLKSSPDENNPFSKMAILVINEEISNRYSKNWEYSYALSYRRSNNYNSEAPYEELNPAIEQEFRVYGRYSYITEGNGLKWKNTIRQEFRKFFNPDFSNTEENFQLRTRLKTQLSLDLGSTKTHHIIGGAEVLFAISKENEPEKEWSKFDYKESRLTLYYSLTPHEIPFIFDVGYMYNLIGKGSDISDVNYLALDIIWKNPFGA
ncbi:MULTISPECIES: DUF2490 domain-containing protein [Flavobacterium]|uniref:DUF2490 domain-containing protein n=1 Tax=Flavobacterium ginsengisoli TaxID=871694 RepID=A0ABP7FNQ7_9FLAO|nr:DUF2490 domain-containing protein [Flavobacterium sp. IB48]MBJ2125902.1 hypothetical protein [Flavobacterium sp. IB48]